MAVHTGGYLHGLMSYAGMPSLIHRRLMLIDMMLVVDMFDPAGVADALIQSIGPLANRIGCKAVQITQCDLLTQEYRTWLTARLTEHGFPPPPLVAAVTVDPPPPNDGTAQASGRVNDRSSD